MEDTFEGVWELCWQLFEVLVFNEVSKAPTVSVGSGELELQHVGFTKDK